MRLYYMQLCFVAKMNLTYVCGCYLFIYICARYVTFIWLRARSKLMFYAQICIPTQSEPLLLEVWDKDKVSDDFLGQASMFPILS